MQFYAVEGETEGTLQRSASFCAIFYGPWFLTSSIPQSAPRMDLEMIGQMKMFCEYDNSTSQAVIKAIQLQSWYLTPFMVAMTLVDEDVEDKERQKIAQELLKMPIPVAFSVGRPKFKSIYGDIKLVDL